MPAVSVIIPVYNSAHTIARAVSSALDQTFKDLEVIVVDDGSTDDLEAECRALAGSIRLIRQDNGGPAAARNRGIERSSGDVIAFLDADDFWLPDKLASQLPLLEKSADVGAVFGNVGFWNERGFAPRDYFDLYRPHRGNVFMQLFAENFVPFTSVLVRRRALESVGLFAEDLKFNEDYDLLLRIARAWTFDYVSERVAAHRISSHQMTRNQAEAAKYLVQMKERIYRSFQTDFQNVDKKILDRGLYDPYLTLAFCNMRIGNKASAKQSLNKYLKEDGPTWPYLKHRLALLLPSAVLVTLIRWRDAVRRRPEWGVH